MKNGFLLFGLVAACLPLIARGTTLQSDAETPLYSNVQVVSIDAALRVIVIRDAKGRKESLVFDDLLASSGSIRAGDRVIVTVLGGPGRRRVSAIALAGITPAPSAIKARVPGPAITGAERMAAREMFARQVAAASQDARSLDASWASFVTACDVRQPENLSGGRAWFGLWDGRVQADYSGGFCRDLFNQIVSSGEGIKQAMAAAESGVQNVLEPGDIRDVRRLHNMNWDGWTLPAPAKREP